MLRLEEMLEIQFKESCDFLKIKETLTRIGIESELDNTLYQSCHILHKRGKYYIVHFKEMFLLDGKQSDFSEADKARRNSIARMLENWNLLKIVNPEIMTTNVRHDPIKVISFSEKQNWNLVSKYTIGNK